MLNPVEKHSNIHLSNWTSTTAPRVQPQVLFRTRYNAIVLHIVKLKLLGSLIDDKDSNAFLLKKPYLILKIFPDLLTS